MLLGHNVVMRSKLFVPGTRPELFDKALASAADALSFDLEDSVTEERKAEGRATVAAWLQRPRPDNAALIIVRVNALETGHFEADAAALVPTGVAALNVPKLESADEVGDIVQRLVRLERASGRTRPTAILANIETPRGLRHAAAIATADARIIGLQIGFADLFEPYGIDRRDENALAQVRLTVRLAAAEAEIPAYDGAFVDVDDLEGYRSECETARRFGFAGKSCIHPRQIEIANEMFRPSAADIERARRILAAAEEKRGVGAFMLNGTMIDEPFIARARAVLAQAGEPGA
jgi:citrate lyase subunit beta/citryl-CoA lyase